MKQGTQSQCSGTTWRVWVGRRVGGGFEMKVTCVYLWPIHIDAWKKPSQRCSHYPSIKINKHFFFLRQRNLNKQKNLGIDFCSCIFYFSFLPVLAAQGHGKQGGGDLPSGERESESRAGNSTFVRRILGLSRASMSKHSSC